MSKSALLAVVLASREPASRFTADELRVLVNLAEHLNDDTGQCNPGRNRLATETGIDRANVRRILLALEERGEIARVGTTRAAAAKATAATPSCGSCH
jgi:DNA-binding MarR family transcriptional regulator